MADNVKIPEATGGSDPEIATDDIGGVQYQRIKTGWGADGAYADASAATPLPVVQTGTPALPTDAATATLQTAGNAILTTMDADTGNISTKIDTLAGAVSAGKYQTEIVSSATLTVNLPANAATEAKQDTLIGHVDNVEATLTSIDGDTGTIATHAATLAGAVSGTEMQVDVLTMPTVTVNPHAVTNAGTFAVQVTSIAAGDNNIGNVDVVSLPALAAGTNNIGDVDVLTLPALPTGANVIGGVTQSGTWNVGTVTAVTAITNALPAGSNAIGKLAANSGVDIGDVDVASIAAGNNVIGQVKLTDGTTVATVMDLTNSNAVVVSIVDDNGNQITSFGGGSGGTQYTEGDTDATITGTAMLMEGAANTLLPVQGTVADGMLVNLGANNDVTVSGVSTSANQSTIIGHVDGIETLLGTIDADTGGIATSAATIAGAVSGSEMQVDVVTMPSVTLNALPAGSNNIGDVDVLSLPALPTGANVIGAVTQSGTWNVGTVTTLPAITGTVTANAGTNLNTSALALESGGNLAAAVTALQIMDDWDETNRCAVNVIAGQSGVQGGSGAVSNTTQRVVLATDVGLPAGANALGSVSVTGTVTVGAHAVTQSGTWNVGTVTTVSTVTAVTTVSTVTTVGTLTNITNWGNLVDDAAFTPATTRLSMSGFFADEASTDSVDEGDGGAARMTLDRKQIVTAQPHIRGGCSVSRIVSAASTNLTQAKGSAGQVYGAIVSNVNAAARYLKIYNQVSASVTVGTTTPIMTIIIPGNAAGAGNNVFIPVGIECSTGISYALTTEATDAGTTGVAASEIVVNLMYF